MSLRLGAELMQRVLDGLGKLHDQPPSRDARADRQNSGPYVIPGSRIVDPAHLADLRHRPQTPNLAVQPVQSTFLQNFLADSTLGRDQMIEWRPLDGSFVGVPSEFQRRKVAIAHPKQDLALQLPRFAFHEHTNRKRSIWGDGTRGLR